jgi:hypothetical protein
MASKVPEVCAATFQLGGGAWQLLWLLSSWSCMATAVGRCKVGASCSGDGGARVPTDSTAGRGGRTSCLACEDDTHSNSLSVRRRFDHHAVFALWQRSLRPSGDHF